MPKLLTAQKTKQEFRIDENCSIGLEWNEGRTSRDIPYSAIKTPLGDFIIYFIYDGPFVKSCELHEDSSGQHIESFEICNELWEKLDDVLNRAKKYCENLILERIQCVFDFINANKITVEHIYSETFEV